jgi:hypothetical protein
MTDFSTIKSASAVAYLLSRAVRCSKYFSNPGEKKKNQIAQSSLGIFFLKYAYFLIAKRSATVYILPHIFQSI